ncbi:MAG TPA: M17 family peptidase N-terminal domain-containing protein, partial [Stellaceae bacterium]|nr:M17 family peptidase N-terminal domain-containing protein [Stellaceae bacterium]
MRIEFAESKLPRSGAVVVGVWEEGTLTPTARRLDEATGGALGRALAASPRFRGRKDDLLSVVAPPGLPVSRIVLAGLGKPAAAEARLLQDLGGALAAYLNGAGEREATVAIDLGEGAVLGEAEAAAELAFGARLRSYRFDKYKTREKPERKRSLARLTVATPSPEAAERAFSPRDKAADAICFARDLVSEPANVIYPETLAAQAESLGEFGVAVEILDEEKMRALGMNALLAVAQGSARPPRLVVLQWHGAGKGEAPLAFIGKGVTFDTGGLSIKPAAGMEEMKWDMAGSAVVIGLMRLLAARKARVNAVGVAGLVEN